MPPKDVTLEGDPLMRLGLLILTITAVGITVWPAVGGDDILYFRDHTAAFRPLLKLLVDAYADGEWGLWNASWGGGEPLAAVPGSMAYSPLLWIFALPGDFHQLYDLFIAAHLPLASLSAYVLGRTLGQSPAAATMCAVVYALSGTIVSMNSLVPLLSSAVFGPLALSAAIGVMRSPSMGGVALLAGALALHVYGTDPAFLVCDIVLFIVAAAAFIRRPRPSLVRAAVGLTAGAVLAAGVAAVAILPLLDVLRGSLRGAGFDYAYLAAYSLHPMGLFELFLAGANGEYYDGPTFYSTGGSRYLTNIYVGAAVFPLIVLSLADRPGRRWVATALFFLLAALGTHTPLHGWLVELVPGLDSSRYPVKFLYGFAIATAIAAGLALDQLRRAVSATVALRVTTAAAVAFAIVSALLLGGDSWLEGPMTPGHSYAMARPYFIGALSQSLLAGAPIVLIVYIRGKTELPVGPMSFIVLAIVATDLSLTLRNDFSVMDGSLYDPPEAAAHVRAEGHPVVYLHEPLKLPSSGTLRTTTQFTFERLVAGIGANLGFRYVFDPDLTSTRQGRWRTLRAELLKTRARQRVHAMGRLGVTHLLWERGIPEQVGVRYVGRGAVQGGDPILVHEVVAHRPEVSFAGRVVVTETMAKLVARSATEPFDTAVVLKKDFVDHQTHLAPLRQADVATATVAVVRSVPDAVTAQIEADASGLLVLTGRSGPGWRAQVDGRDTPTFDVDGILLGVPVPAGPSHVRVTYRPAGFVYGAMITAVCSALVVALWAIDGWRRRRRP